MRTLDWTHLHCIPGMEVTAMTLAKSTAYANAQTREKYWNSPDVPAQVKDVIRELMETVEHQAKIIDELDRRTTVQSITITNILATIANLTAVAEHPSASKHIRRPAGHKLGSVEATQ